MIEVPSVSHAAWAYCRTRKSFKMLKREGRVGGVSRITHNLMYSEKNEMMTTCEFLQAKYTVALFSPLDVSVRKKKHAARTIFSAFCTEPNDPLCCKSLYFNLFHSLSPK